MSEIPPVLLVDDRPDDRELVALVLRGAFGKVTVEEAPDAAALARAVTAGRCGLVLAEHDLPWIRGGDLVRLVRDLWPGVPIVMLTARPLDEVAAELLHLRPDAVVPKTSPGLVDLPRVIRRLLEERRRAPAAAAPAGATEVEEMAYVVSHDLRQPLTQVVRALEMIGAGAGTDGQSELLDLARRGAHRLETLLDGVIRYARVPADGALAPVALEPLLARVLERLADERAACGGEVTHDPLPTVEASVPQMEQLFQNLIANAFKFRGAEPARVHVGARDEGEHWHLTVRDNGLGIDKKDHERVFGLFQRLHTEAEFPGSGIGLALCRRIVARHGGRIWVESSPGAGATFHVTLAKDGRTQTGGPTQTTGEG